MSQKIKITYLVFFLVMLITGLDVFASSGQRHGTAGAQELLIPVGSRGTALNGAYTSGIDGIEAIFWNPSGLTISDHKMQVMFSHHNYLADMAVNYGAVAANFGNLGALGLSIKFFDFGEEIVETTIENPDGTGRTFSPLFLTLGLTYARQMTERLNFGATLKIISEQIINAKATGYAFDFGMQYSTGLDGLKLGFALKNFGPKMAFSGPELEHKVQLPGTEAGADQERLSIKAAEFELPSQFEFGVSYLFDMGKENTLTVMGLFQNNSFSFDTYNFASEYSFNDWVFLRASYSLAQRESIDGKYDGFISSSEDYLFGPAFGAGLVFSVGNSVKMNIDYTYRTSAIFSGGLQWFTINFGL